MHCFETVNTMEKSKPEHGQGSQESVGDWLLEMSH